MDSVFSAGKYVTWGVVSISATNLLIIVLMVVVFVLALVLPFPHGRPEPSLRSAGDEPHEEEQP
jgi:hypothetical protein